MRRSGRRWRLQEAPHRLRSRRRRLLRPRPRSRRRRQGTPASPATTTARTGSGSVERPLTGEARPRPGLVLYPGSVARAEADGPRSLPSEGVTSQVSTSPGRAALFAQHIRERGARDLADAPDPGRPAVAVADDLEVRILGHERGCDPADDDLAGAWGCGLERRRDGVRRPIDDLPRRRDDVERRCRGELPAELVGEAPASQRGEAQLSAAASPSRSDSPRPRAPRSRRRCRPAAGSTACPPRRGEVAHLDPDVDEAEAADERAGPNGLVVGESAFPANAFALSATSATHASAGIAGCAAHPAAVPACAGKGLVGREALANGEVEMGPARVAARGRQPDLGAGRDPLPLLDGDAPDPRGARTRTAGRRRGRG